jgi:hypothetical protein
VLQKEHYSGKKKAHTDKNLVLINETTCKVVYLSPTARGKRTTRKRLMRPTLPTLSNATLDKDTGFQGRIGSRSGRARPFGSMAPPLFLFHPSYLPPIIRFS